MTPTEVGGYAIGAVILLFLLLLTLRWAWNRATNWAARHIEHHIARALERPLHTRYRDLDDEYRALVLAEHNEPTE